MPKKQSKKQSGTWFFKCIQQCEFAQDTWTPDEVIAVPAGTEVPAEWFEEIGRLPYASACLAIDASDRPRISIGKSDKGEFRYISITDLPEYALRAAKALPCSGILGNSVVLSISVDGCRAKLAFLEAYVFYTVAVVRAIEKAGDRNIALFPPTEVPAHWGLSGWDMVLRRRFEWDLLEEYALWQKNGRPGPFEDWLDTRRPGLFQSTGRPGEPETRTKPGPPATRARVNVDWGNQETQYLDFLEERRKSDKPFLRLEAGPAAFIRGTLKIKKNDPRFKKLKGALSKKWADFRETHNLPRM